jgi:hypothetical protein
MTEAEILRRLPRLPRDITATATDLGKYIAIGLSRDGKAQRVIILKRLFEKFPAEEAETAAKWLMDRLDNAVIGEDYD